MALSELEVVVAALRAGFTPPLVLVPDIGDALKPLVEIASPGNIAKLFGGLMCSATVDYGPFKVSKRSFCTRKRFVISELSRRIT